MTIRAMLTGGDRRSIGRADEVVQLVHAHSRRFQELVECLWDADPIVRMRSADAIEKISRTAPALIQPYKPAILEMLASELPKEVRWHLVMIATRFTLSSSECKALAQQLHNYLDDRSAIVKTCALQSLWDLAQIDASLLPAVLDLLQHYERAGTPAMRARCRILLKHTT